MWAPQMHHIRWPTTHSMVFSLQFLRFLQSAVSSPQSSISNVQPSPPEWVHCLRFSSQSRQTFHMANCRFGWPKAEWFVGSWVLRGTESATQLHKFSEQLLININLYINDCPGSGPSSKMGLCRGNYAKPEFVQQLVRLQQEMGCQTRGPSSSYTYIWRWKMNKLKLSHLSVTRLQIDPSR